MLQNCVCACGGYAIPGTQHRTWERLSLAYLETGERGPTQALRGGKLTQKITVLDRYIRGCGWTEAGKYASMSLSQALPDVCHIALASDAKDRPAMASPIPTRFRRHQHRQMGLA